MRSTLLSAVLLFACGATRTGAELGSDLVSDPSLGGKFNPFACTTCHSVAGTGESRLFSGYSLWNSAFRETYWGGYIRDFDEAVSFCLQFFMGGAPLDSSSQEGRALYEYFVSISEPGATSALPLTIVENVTDVARGDRSRGEEVYDAACRDCHGALHTGDGHLEHPNIVVLPEVTEQYAKDFPEVDPALVVVEKVRHGQFFLVGGNMPFMAREMLSDDDLGALLAFLEL